MVQSDVPQSRTKSGKINARWYLQRLRASANSRQHNLNKFHDNDKNVNKINYSDTIRVVRGTTATQGQHIPRVFLTSPTKSFENETIKQKSNDNIRSNSIHLTSATSIKSTSTLNKNTPSLNEFISNNSQIVGKQFEKDEKESLSERRSSIGTYQSLKIDLINRPPSTPVDSRCHRSYSPTTNPIDRQMCSLLGPQLCSDCIEVQTRANLSPERLPVNIMHQRLSALALRRFLKNEQYLTDDDLLRLVNNQQIQIKTKISNDINCSIPSDDEYFDRLSLSISQNTNERPFYFKNLKDFSEKYQTNKYERLLLSETPSPKSANPIFKQSSFEKFDISSKYSFMKKASTIKPNLKSNCLSFLSTRRFEQISKENRDVTNSSPPLVLKTSQENIRKTSNKNLFNKYNLSSNKQSIQRRTFITSKSLHRVNFDV